MLNKLISNKISKLKDLDFVMYVILGISVLLFIINTMLQRPNESLFLLYLPNIVTSLLSIFISYKIIDRLIEFRNDQLQKNLVKNQLLSDFGSSINAIAVRAAEKMSALGYLEDGTLDKITLVRADLSRAELSGIVITDAQLVGVDFTDSMLDCSELQGTTFGNCYLYGTNFEDCDLTDTTFNNSLYDDLTKWPAGFDPKKAGALLNNVRVNLTPTQIVEWKKNN